MNNPAVFAGVSSECGDTLYPHMAVPRELAERLVDHYPDASNYPEALRRAGWDAVG